MAEARFPLAFPHLVIQPFRESFPPPPRGSCRRLPAAGLGVASPAVAAGEQAGFQVLAQPAELPAGGGDGQLCRGQPVGVGGVFA
jgi:hypothetical protein